MHDNLYTGKIKVSKVLPLDTEDPELADQDHSVLIRRAVSMLTEVDSVIFT